MKIFGIEFRNPLRSKTAVGVTDITPLIDPSGGGGFWRSILEPFTGAWQRNIRIESNRNILAFSAVYRCISMIGQDIGKLRPRLLQLLDNGVWVEATSASPYWQVLRKPNSYQTRIQFIENWLGSKLIHGNTYVLKERNANNIVVRLHILDPRLVTVLTTDDGSVFYELKRDKLSRGEQDQIAVPASEIIHDRMMCFWHPLIGISPIYACGISATQGIRIQNNSALFFENMSRPSGVLTAPASISDEVAKRLKAEFETNFSGSNIGRLLVAGDGLKYQPMTIPATDAQLVQQLKWTVEDVARCFGVPLYKLASGENPKFQNTGELNQDYYTQTLQTHIESIEVLLDEGLEVDRVRDFTYGIELDIRVLLRMDPSARAEAASKLVTAAILAPNEARLDENREPVKGGEFPLAQQQIWPLNVLADRPPPVNPSTQIAPPADTPPPKSVEVISAEFSPVMEGDAKLLANALIAKFMRETAND